MNERDLNSKILDTIFKSDIYGVVLLNKNRRVIKANQRVLNIFGITIKGFQGKSVKVIHVNEDHYKEFDKHYLSLKTKDVVIEYPFRHQNGSIIWCKLTGMTLNRINLDDGAIWILEDITQEKKFMVPYNNIDNFHRFKTQNSLAYQSLDINGNIIYVNNEWEKLFKKNYKEILNINFNDLLDKDSKIIFKKIFKKLLNNGYVQDQNIIIIDNNNKVCHVTLEGLVEYDLNGNFLQANCVLKDITSEIQAEKKLQESERRYKLLADNISDVIWTMDLRGNFTYVSPSVVQLRGYTPEEVQQQSILTSIKPEHAQQLMQTLREGIENEKKGIKIPKRLEFEAQQMHKDGHYIWTEVAASPIRDKNGILREIIGATRNIENRKKHEELLKEHEQTLSSIFKATPIGIGLTIDRVFTKINNAFCLMLGYKEEELLGKNTRFVYISHEEYNRVGKLKQSHIDKIGYSVFKSKLVSKKGQEFDVIISNAPINPNNESEGMVFTCIDISEITETERALKESQRQMQTLLDNLQGMAYRCKNDENWTMQFISDAVENITGYSANEIIDNKEISYNDITHPNDRAYIRSNIAQAIRKEGHFAIEYRIITKNNEVKWVWEQGIGIKDKNNELVFIEGYINDITDRKIALQNLEKTSLELKRSLRFTEILLNSVPIPVFYKDKSGKYIGCNKAYLSHLGFTIDKIIGKTARDLWPDELGDNYFIKDLELLNNPKSAQTYEYIIRTRNGELRNAIFAKNVFYDEYNNVAGILGAFQDITDMKIANTQLENAKRKAEESDRLKTAFLQNMSHEIRTPMNGIVGFCNLLKNENIQKPEKEKYINIITQSSNQLLNIVNDILDISKIETNQVKLIVSGFDLRKTLEYLYNLHKPQITGKGLKFSLNLPQNSEKELLIKSDEEKIIQITNNLLTNATKFTLKGYIKLGCYINNNNIIIFVEDTGIGINKEMHEIVFDRFRRLDTGNTLNQTGTGLGLSISKGLANILNGKLEVDSTPNKGSIFKLYIPHHITEQIYNIKNNDIEISSTHKPGKILIAEDDDINYYYIKTLLKQKNYTILRVRNGREAVEACVNDNSIALVLMDIKMPIMDGIEATKIIRQKRPDVIIIAQSAYAMERDRNKAISVGCHDYISKPVDPDELYRKIEPYFIQN